MVQSGTRCTCLDTAACSFPRLCLNDSSNLCRVAWLFPAALPQRLIKLVSFLLAAVGGMDKKRVHYVEGGQAGNREDKINNLIQRMN